MDDYLSVYKKDFIAMKLDPTKKTKVESEFRDPVMEPFKDYLTINDSPEFEKDPVEEYRLEVGKKLDKIGEKYFSTPVDKEVVKNFQLDQMRTIYKGDYEDLQLFKKFLEEDHERKMFRLPSDWNLPETTQTAGYRDPAMLNPNVYHPVQWEKQKDNLVPDEKLRKLLNVKTGETDYQANIGKVGENIMEHELHGKRNYPSCNLDVKI